MLQFQILRKDHFGYMEYDSKQLCTHQVVDKLNATVDVEQEMYSFKDLPYKFIEHSFLREVDTQNMTIWRQHFNLPVGTSKEKNVYKGTVVFSDFIICSVQSESNRRWLHI